MSFCGLFCWLQPGTFPKSFCAYVERALARCKDDAEKAACQNLLKEVDRCSTHSISLKFHCLKAAFCLACLCACHLCFSALNKSNIDVVTCNRITIQKIK